jgi:hypothetical protein
VIVVLLRQINQRHRQNTKKQRQFEVDRQAALDAERKQQALSVRPKAKVPVSKTRIPLGDPFGTPFTGAIQGSAAKWEAEIHQMGRQMIGQIDSKMAALQALTLDANRTANRLEILVEHLEQIARQQIEWQASQRTQQDQAPEHVPNVIPVTESTPESAPLAEVLKELSNDLEGFHKAVEQSITFGKQPATVLRLSEFPTNNLRNEVEMLSNYGLDVQEIARKLNISPGEVDVMLQVQEHR